MHVRPDSNLHPDQHAAPRSYCNGNACTGSHPLGNADPDTYGVTHAHTGANGNPGSSPCQHAGTHRHRHPPPHRAADLNACSDANS